MRDILMKNSLASILNTAGAFIRKDMKIALSYRMQFVFQFAQIFFSVSVVYFIGKMLADKSGDAIASYDSGYFAFALVGIAINNYLHVGLVTITNEIRQTMNQGTLEAMCAAPLSYAEFIVCSSLWQFVFETFRVVLYFLFAMVIFGLRLNNINWLSTFLCMSVTIPVFLLLGTMSCSILIVIKRGDPVNWFFSSAGALLAGTMFPVSVLPDWLQAVSVFLPLTHALNAARKAILTGAAPRDIASSLLVLGVWFLLLVPAALFINRECMTVAKRQGAFSTF